MTKRRKDETARLSIQISELKNHRVGSPLIASALTIVSSSRAVALALVLHPSVLSSFSLPLLILFFFLRLSFSFFTSCLLSRCVFVYLFYLTYSLIIFYLFSIPFVSSPPMSCSTSPYKPASRTPYSALCHTALRSCLCRNAMDMPRSLACYDKLSQSMIVVGWGGGKGKDRRRREGEVVKLIEGDQS